MWLRLLIALPFLVVLLSFALSNRLPVQLGLWPTGFSLELPLSMAILCVAGVAFLLGALFVWVAELQQRSRARRAEHALKLVEEQVRELKARLPASGMLPPGA